MTRRTTVKTSPRFVGVITTRAESRLAGRMKNPPHLFELRLDHVRKIDIALRAPFIITARDPREGGANMLSIKQRRDLLAQFLDRARWVDIELRNAGALKSIVDLARRKKIGVIMSCHDFHSTPSARRLSAMASKAKSLGAGAFKIAARTDTKAQLARLQDFAENADVDLPLIVMGVGKLALLSRTRIPSVFAYAALKAPRFTGQPTLAQLRSAFRRRAVR